MFIIGSKIHMPITSIAGFKYKKIYCPDLTTIFLKNGSIQAA